MSGLTEKQKRFCQEYVIDLNATQAAIRAGYSEDTADVQGSRLLGNVKVEKIIKELQESKSNNLNITFEDVVNGVWEIAQTGVKDSDRLKAYDQVSKHLGFYEKDNEQTKAVTNISLKDLVSFDNSTQ